MEEGLQTFQEGVLQQLTSQASDSDEPLKEDVRKLAASVARQTTVAAVTPRS